MIKKMIKKALLGLALFGVALAGDLRNPPENPISSFNLQQQTGRLSLNDLNTKIAFFCNSITMTTYPSPANMEYYALVELYKIDEKIWTERARCLNNLRQYGVYSPPIIYATNGRSPLLWFVSNLWGGSSCSSCQILSSVRVSGNNLIVCAFKYSAWDPPMNYCYSF